MDNLRCEDLQRVTHGGEKKKKRPLLCTKKNRDAWQIETGLGVHTPDVPPPPSLGTHVVGGLDDDGGDEDAGDGVREPEAEAAAEDPDDDDPRREAVHPVVVGVGDRRVRLRRLPHRHHHLKEGGWGGPGRGRVAESP